MTGNTQRSGFTFTGEGQETRREAEREREEVMRCTFTRTDCIK